MKPFELSTTKSLNPAIEIVVDKKTYRTRLLSQALFDTMKVYQKAAVKGDQSAYYKQVQLLYPIPTKVISKLDIRDINSLLEYTMSQIIPEGTPTKKGKAGKNVSKPGEKTSA